MWRGDPSYGYRALNIENPGRGLQQPPTSKDVLQQMAQEDEGKGNISLLF